MRRMWLLILMIVLHVIVLTGNAQQLQTDCADVFAAFEQGRADAALGTFDESECDDDILRAALEAFAAGEVASFSQETETALDFFHEAESLFSEVDYFVGELRSINRRSSPMFFLGDAQGARQLSEQVLQRTRETDSKLVEAEALLSLAFIDILEGQLEDGSSRIELARSLVEQLENPLLSASLSSSYGFLELVSGDSNVALEFYSDATVLYAEIGDLPNVAAGYELQAFIYGNLGQLEQALIMYQQAIEVYESLDYGRLPYAFTLLSMAGVLFGQEEYAEAASTLLTANEIVEEHGLDDLRIPVVLLLARSYLEQNAFQDALIWSNALREAAVARGDLQNEYEALIIEAIALSGTWQFDVTSANFARIQELVPLIEPENIELLAFAQEYLSILDNPPDSETGWDERLQQAGTNPDLQIRVLLAEARWYVEEQRLDEALDAASLARDVARSNNMVLAEAQILTLVGAIYANASQPSAALAAYEEARTLVSEDEAFPTFLMTLLAAEGDIYAAEGLYELSASRFESGLEIAVSLGNTDLEADVTQRAPQNEVNYAHERKRIARHLHGLSDQFVRTDNPNGPVTVVEWCDQS